MKISANQLKGHLENNLLPCYLVCGDEPLLVTEALDEIRRQARAEGFESRELHTAVTGFDWSELGAASSNLSLFAERRIIELKRLINDLHTELGREPKYRSPDMIDEDPSLID